MSNRHNNRKFNRAAYNHNDKRAKDALVSYLKLEGYDNIQSTEDYHFDIHSEKEINRRRHQQLFEVEIKNQWKDSWNPSWTEIRIPQRKIRLIDKWEKDYPTSEFTFVVLNYNCKQGWFIPAKIVKGSKVDTIKNSRRIGEPHLKEPFFHIPMESATLKKLVDN
tara:strand:- start:142 stop:633 length:492 start_codon:yes stop_codon:yes gene_type:complete